jgi:hypothetical protein
VHLVARRWELAPGRISLGASGTIAGTPTAAGSDAFFLVAQDSASHAVQKAFSLFVDQPVPPAPVLNQISPTTAQAGSASFVLDLTGQSFATNSEVLWDGAQPPLASTFSPTPT